jgi:RimJ/RimL family protein N-acetyltransferase
MNKVLRDINSGDILPFCYSMSEEWKYYGSMSYVEEMINTAVFIKGIHTDNRLVAIGGISRSFPLRTYYPWYTIISAYQGKGIGTELANSNFDFARENGISYFLTTVDKGNLSSEKILKKQGYRTIFDTGDQYHIYFPFNKRGKLICLTVFPLIFRIYYSPFRRIIDFTINHLRIK